MTQQTKTLVAVFALALMCCLAACAPRFYSETSETTSPEGIIVATPPEAAEEPEAAYEAPVYEEPIYIDPEYDDPEYDYSADDGPIYEGPEGEELVYDAPVYEEPVFEAPIYEEPTYESPGLVTPLPGGSGVATGESCGGMTGLTCRDPNDACIMTMAQQCGAADGMGVCTPRPLACTQDYRPVCGCDGNNYANACSANSAGVSPAYEGECQFE